MESKSHILFAWLLLWLSVVGGGVLAVYLLSFVGLYFVGGIELVSDVLGHRETGDYGSIIYTSIFIGIPIGAVLCVRLWARLMRKTGFISNERIKRMSGF